MVYVIAVYDVHAQRTQLFLKFLRRYLTHVQHSVFEGDITEGEVAEIREGLQEMVEDGESTILYVLSSDKLVDRTVFGEDPTEDQRFL